MTAPHSAEAVSLQGKTYITTKEASRLSGYTPAYIRQLALAGKLPSEKIGRKKYVELNGLRTFLESADTAQAGRPRIASPQLAPRAANAVDQQQGTKVTAPTVSKDDTVSQTQNTSDEDTAAHSAPSPHKKALRIASPTLIQTAVGFALIVLVFGLPGFFAGDDIVRTYKERDFSNITQASVLSALSDSVDTFLTTTSNLLTTTSNLVYTTLCPYVPGTLGCQEEDTAIVEAPPAGGGTTVITNNVGTTTIIERTIVQQQPSTPLSIVASGLTETDLTQALADLRAELLPEIDIAKNSPRVVFDPDLATSYLTLTDTPSQFAAHRIPFANSSASALTDSANLTFNGSQLTVTGSITTDTLGVGTTSPTDTFSLNGPAYFASITAPSNTSNRLYNASGDLYWAGSIVGGSTVGTWTTDGTNVWRASGNVGIGTSSPYTTLSVAGGGHFDGDVRLDGSLGIGLSPLNPLDVDVGTDTRIAFGFRNNDAEIRSVNDAGSATQDLRLFGTNIIIGDTTTSNAANLYVESTGFVGVGTTSPFAKLSVEQNAGEVGFAVGSSTATNFIVDANGNVGIGTASPAASLYIEQGSSDNTEGLRIQNGIRDFTFYIDNLNQGVIDSTGIEIKRDGVGKIRFRDSDILPLDTLTLGLSTNRFSSLFTNNTIDVALSSDTQAFIASTSPGQTADIINISDTSGTQGNLFTIDSSGNVGIGTSNPTASLHISGSNSGALIVGGASVMSSALRVERNGGGGGSNASAPNQTMLTSEGNSSIVIAGRDKTSGSGGVGDIYIAAHNNSSPNVGQDAGSIRLYAGVRSVGTGSSGSIIFNTGNSERLRIDPSGNLGLGTTSPTTLLTVGSTTPNSIASANYYNSAFVSGDLEVDGTIYGTTLTSSGLTEGSVVFATSSGQLSQDNSNFFWDDANNRLGIGTQSPQKDLHIIGSTPGSGMVMERSGGEFFRVGAGEAGASLGYSDGGTLTIGPIADYDTSLEQGLILDASNRVKVNGQYNDTIASTFEVNGNIAVGTSFVGTAAPSNGLIVEGNVGIGTTSPSSVLHVDDPDDATTLLTLDANSSQEAQIAFQEAGITKWTIRSEAGGARSDFYLQGNDSEIPVKIEGSAADNSLYIDDSGNLGLGSVVSPGSGFTSASLAVLASGNVGIGTTTPGEKLVISGSGSNGIYLTSSNAGSVDTYINFDEGVTSGGRIIYQGSGSNHLKIQARTGVSTYRDVLAAGYQATDFINLASNSGGGSTPYVRFNEGNPDTIQFGARLYLDGVSNTFNIQRESGGAFSDVIVIPYTGSLAGNVGIGTTTPDHMLSIYDSTSSGNNLLQSWATANDNVALSLTFQDVNNEFLFDADLGTGSASAFRFSGAHNLILEETDGNVLLVLSETTEDKWQLGRYDTEDIFAIANEGDRKLSITTSGNVGIGTTSPEVKLHVVNSGNAAARNGLIIDTDGDGDDFPLQVRTDPLGGFDFETKFLVRGDGKVGIGTTTLDALLTIQTNNVADTKGLFIDSDGESGDIPFRIRTNITGGGTVTDSDTKFIVRGDGNVGIGTTSPDELLHVASSGGDSAYFEGQVGIGTANPASTLHLLGTNPDLRFVNSGSASTQIKANSGALDFLTNDGNETALRLDQSGSVYMVVSQGSVGINDTGPDFKLEVVGTSTNGYFGVTNSSDGDIFTIDGIGNVGIGTTSPSDVLSVEGDVSFSEGDEYRSFYWDATQGRLGIGNTSPGALLEISAASAHFRLTDTGENKSWTIYPAGSGGDLVFDHTNTGGVLRLEASGAVGIGDTESDAHLEVSANGTTGGNIFLLSSDDHNDGDLLTVTEAGNVGINDVGPDFKLEVVGTSTSGYFGVTDSSDGDIFTIDGSGNVGIGSTTPSGKLTVSGNILPGTDDTYDLGSNTLRWRDLYLGPSTLHIGSSGDESQISYNTGSDLLTFQNSVDATAGFQFLDADGGNPILNVDTTNERVGIGTAIPSAKLYILLNDGTGSDNGIVLDNNSVGQGKGASIHIKSGGFGFNAPQKITGKSDNHETSPTSQWEFYNTVSGSSDQLVMMIKGGNVGIGTTSPYAKLSVVGPVVAEYFHATSTTATSTFSGGFTAGNNAALTVNQGATANSLYIAENGNVGVGTSTLNGKLTVAGDITPDTTNSRYLGTSTLGWNTIYVNNVVAQVNSGGNNSLTLQPQGFTGSLIMKLNNAGSPTSGVFKIQYDSNRLFQMNYAGVQTWYDYNNSYNSVLTLTPSSTKNVISTLAPDQTSSAPDLEFVGGQGGTIAGNTDGGSIIFTPGLKGSGSGVDGVSYFSRGNVGIGTTSPFATLSASGTVAFAGLSASGGTPDALCLSATNEVTVNTGAADCTVSSERFKSNIQLLSANLSTSDVDRLSSSTLETLLALTPRTFTYKDKPDDERFGLIAEEVLEVEPRLVFFEDDGTTPRGVRYQDAVALVISAVQELSAKVDALTGNLVEFAEVVASKLSADIVYSREVQTDRLCVGSVCVTETEFMKVFGAGVDGANDSTNDSNLTTSDVGRFDGDGDSGGGEGDAETSTSTPPTEEDNIATTTEETTETDTSTTTDETPPSDDGAGQASATSDGGTTEEEPVAEEEPTEEESTTETTSEPASAEDSSGESQPELVEEPAQEEPAQEETAQEEPAQEEPAQEETTIE